MSCLVGELSCSHSEWTQHDSKQYVPETQLQYHYRKKIPVRCRVKIQVNEAMIQIIIGRYKKKIDKPVYCTIFLRFYIVRRLWKIEINIRIIAPQSYFFILFFFLQFDAKHDRVAKNVGGEW